ncbi:MAG: DUF1861 family protein [Anaerolineae bacterium]
MVTNISEVIMSLYSTITPEPLQQQVAEFQKHRPPAMGEILRFEGVDDCDVYNPSVPFTLDGMTILAGRVEKRAEEFSRVVFFTEADGVWSPIEGAPVFELQDPFVTFAGDELVFGGVYVDWEGKRAHWSTVFYRGRSLHDLKLFARGPAQMKDVRLLQLRDGRVAIFSRPQGEVMQQRFGCIAKIGFTIVDSLDDVTADAIEQAPLLFDHFLPDEWGGCNQLFELKNGLIGAVGHKSRGEMVVREHGGGAEHVLHYASMAFAVDPETRAMTPTKIIATRDCFPPGLSKAPRLEDVTFTAGIVRHDDGTATLYTGLSDCQVGRLEIADPVLEYEDLEYERKGE